MPTRIRIDPTRCKREGWRTFERVPAIPIAIGCSLVALAGVALAFATFGETLEAYVFGGALAGSLFAGPMLAIAFGWLFAPLHVVIDGAGPIAALRRSWNTTYGSKRALLRLAFPVWGAIIAFAFTAFFPLHPWRSLGLTLRGASYVFPLVLALVLGPYSLSAAVSGYITLERQREEEKVEARHWLRP